MAFKPILTAMSRRACGKSRSGQVRQTAWHCAAAAAALILTAQISAADTEREPFRVFIPPFSDLRGADAPTVFQTIMGLYLTERCAECGNISLLSASRRNAIYYTLTGVARRTPNERMFQVFSSYWSVDAMLRYSLADSTLKVSLETKSGITSNSIPIKDGMSQAVQAVALFLADALKIPEADKNILTKVRIANDATFYAYYVSQATSAAYPLNSGEAQLKVLQEPWGKNPADPLMAERVLHGTAVLLRSHNRDQRFAGTAMKMAAMALPIVLGTDSESAAQTLVSQKPNAFGNLLFEFCGPLLDKARGEDVDFDVDAVLEDDALPELGVSEEKSGSPANVPWASDKLSDKQRLGAIRLLGLLDSQKALQALKSLAGHEDQSVREATAVGLRHFKDDRGLNILQQLLNDKEASVRFAAGHSLWKRSQPAEGLLTSARSEAASQDRTKRLQAVQILGDFATRDDSALLHDLLQAADSDARFEALRALLRLDLLDARALSRFLNDWDERATLAVLTSLQKKTVPKPLINKVMKLADDFYAPVAEKARHALASARPAAGQEQILFDLDIEHPYLRMKILQDLAAGNEPWAMAALEKACENSDAHTRVRALALLAKKDAQRAHARIMAALRDVHHWVRLHAAAMAADSATPDDAATLQAALSEEKDEAARLFLADALARAEGKPLPAPRSAARCVAAETNLAWGCGLGVDCANSPFDAYYCLSVPPVEYLKKTHGAGKIVFARLNTVGNPGEIAVSSAGQDSFWQHIDAGVARDALPYLDGFVFGEETMNMGADQLWDDGWRLFCSDAGIDPGRVQGNKENLNQHESRAWVHWAGERAVDGFNILYDYVKLKYGKLRPGIQVCTFLPGQGGITPADKRWKFDLGGIYDYKGNNRIAAYTLIRRMKTLWPERPVLWLSLGIGGYEMNPVKRNLAVPKAPMRTRADRAYADSVSAWLAGADIGWFSVWIFVEKDWHGSMQDLKGVQIGVEDITPNSPILNSAIDYSFRGAEEEKADPDKVPKAGEIDFADENIEDMVSDLDTDDREKAAAEQVAAEKENLRRGFLFYRKYVYDCARVFSSLPRLQPRPDALAVKPGLSVWSGADAFNVPGLNLLNAYDFAMDINLLPELELSRYRLIALAGLNDAPLRDVTIAALTAWLKDYPGLLYIHGALSTNNANEAGTPADHDGLLTNDWPWEQDIAPANNNNNYKTSGPSVHIMASNLGGPTLALWQQTGMKGAVLFDAGRSDVEKLRAAINSVAKDRRIGVELTGPAHQEIWREAGLLGVACAGGSTSNVVPGLDLLTGESNPTVGPGRSGALTATNWIGQYAISANGLVVLSQKPIANAEILGDAVRLQSPGWMQATAVAGAVDVKTADGHPLPEVAAEHFSAWLLLDDTEGYAAPTNGALRGVTYIRCKGAVTLSHL